MPAHHPAPELLMDYASGALAEPPALLVACHAALCAACRAEVARLEALGGALLDGLEGRPLDGGALDRALARLDRPEGPQAGPKPTACRDAAVPGPLRGYLAADLDGLPWKRLGGLRHLDLLPGFPAFRTRLLRVTAGTGLPRHGHRGSELTLLLAGGFSDGAGHYRRGDVAAADPSIDHRPVADAGEDCLCLVVTDAPLRLTGRFGRYLNFLARF